MIRLVVACGIHCDTSAHPVATKSRGCGRRPALLVLPIEERKPGLLAKVLQGCLKVKAVPLPKGCQSLLVAGKDLFVRPGQKGSALQGKTPVRGNEARLKVVYGAKAHAAGAGALWRIEGKELRTWRWHGDMAHRAGRGCGIEPVLFFLRFVRAVEHKAPLCFLQGQLHGFRKAGTHALLHNESVHHKIQAMLAVLVQGRHIVNGVHDPVHAHPGKAPSFKFLEPVRLCSLLQFDQGRHDDDPCPLLEAQDFLQDLVRGSGLNGPSALRAIDLAQPCKEDAQKVIDLRHCAHCGAGVVGGRTLLKAYGRCEALDLANVRLVHLGQKLPCIGREAFHIAPLAFSIDNVKGQRGFAGTRGPADDHELVAGDIKAYVVQIVLARVFYMDAARACFCALLGILRHLRI